MPDQGNADNGPIDPRIQKLGDHIAAEFRRLPHLLKQALGKKARIRLPKPRQNHWSLTGLAFGVAKKNPHLTGGRNNADELLQARDFLHSLRDLDHALSGHLTVLQDSIRKLETDLWMEAMRIYGIARHSRLNPAVAQLVEDMQKELAHGPRQQTSTTTPLAEPIPRSKRALKKQLLEKAGADAAGRKPPSGEGGG